MAALTWRTWKCELVKKRVGYNGSEANIRRHRVDRSGSTPSYPTTYVCRNPILNVWPIEVEHVGARQIDFNHAQLQFRVHYVNVRRC